MQGFLVPVVESMAPAFQAWYVAYPSYHFHYQSVTVAFGEEIEGYETEDDYYSHRDAYGWRHRGVAKGCKNKIEEYGGEPQPEMGKDMHHGIEYHRRRGMLLGDVS